MKTIFKFLSLILIISLSSCDRPLESEEYLIDRAPFVGFQGVPDVLFVQNGDENTYEIFVGISSPIDSTVTYSISNDSSSDIVEGTDFSLQGNFSIAGGERADSFTLSVNYESISSGPSTVYLNLISDDDIQIGTKNQFELTIVK